MIVVRAALRRQLALLLVFTAFSLPGVAQSQGAAGPLVPPCADPAECTLDVIRDQVLPNIFNWLVIVAGSAAVLAVVVAGTRYIVAVLQGADSSAIAEAKHALAFAIFGTVLLLVSYVLVKTVCFALTGSQNCPVSF